MDPLVVDGRVVIPAIDLTWTAVRASGPGGQNVNKVSSKVELRFDLAGCRVLDPATKARLRALAGDRLDTRGCLLIKSQVTRDQARNLEDAREKLRALVLRALTPPKPRRPTRPGRAARARRLDDKRHHADKKRSRRPGGDS